MEDSTERRGKQRKDWCRNINFARSASNCRAGASDRRQICNAMIISDAITYLMLAMAPNSLRFIGKVALNRVKKSCVAHGNRNPFHTEVHASSMYIINVPAWQVCSPFAEELGRHRLSDRTSDCRRESRWPSTDGRGCKQRH